MAGKSDSRKSTNYGDRAGGRLGDSKRAEGFRDSRVSDRTQSGGEGFMYYKI